MSFNKWKESTSNKPTSSVLYSPKYREHREKLRNLDSNKFSMRNPSPSREDFEAFDADRRFREHARDVRQASRSEVRTPNKAESHNNKRLDTPEQQKSPISEAEDQFYTPMRAPPTNFSPSSNDESFATPMTSNLGDYSNLSNLDKLRIRQKLLDEQMNRSFENMSRTFGRAETPEKQLRDENEISPVKFIAEAPGHQQILPPKSPDSDKFSLLDSIENSPRITAPIPQLSTPQKIVKFEQRIESTSENMSYVETLICASQMQRKYSEEAEKMEQQLEKLEKIKKSVERLEAGGNKETPQKSERIAELRNKLEQIGKVKRMIWQLDNRNEQNDSDDEKELQNIEILEGIQNSKEFERQYTKDLKRFSKELKVLLDVFREKMTAKKERKMRRRMLRNGSSSRRNSEAMKIEPLAEKMDIGTQMTPRIEEEKEEEDLEPRESTPRKAGVEPLDLSSLKNKNGMDEKVAGLNEMLDSIVLNDKSLEDSPFCAQPDVSIPNIEETSFLNTSETSFRKFETIFPSRPTSAADETPKSARGSLDLSSARKLSAGIAHFLEIHQKSIDASRISSDLEELENEVSSEPVTVEERVEEVEKEDEKKEEDVWKAITSTVFDEEEGDEVKKFVIKDEYEDDFEDDEANESSTNTVIEETSLKEAPKPITPNESSFNDSADDSGFLLNNKPVPKIKSLLDNPAVLQHLADTPRKENEHEEADFEDTLNETNDQRVDIDTCCRELVPSFGEVMISKAVEKQKELRGCDWCSALDVWQPSNLLQQYKIEDLDDPYDVFDSFWVTVWGEIVDLLNSKYLKYTQNEPLSQEAVAKFEKEAKEYLNAEYGPNSKKVEWHQELKTCKKVENLMLYHVDYRYEIRRMMTEHEKQRYRFTQLQMNGICERYSAKILDCQLAEIYNSEKEKLAASIVLNSIDA